MLWAAANAAAGASMTGEMYRAMLDRPEPLDANGYLEREKAYSYLDGIKDASQGRVWCEVGQLKTPDLAYDIADRIGRMQPAERQRSAALIVLDVLRRAYPCDKSASRKK